ncbi:MAG: LiaF domain-containing protein [Actinomycetota bacterium]
MAGGHHRARRLVQLAEQPRSAFGPGIVIAAGVVVLLFTTDVLEGNVFTIIWPLLLIVVGIAILFRHGRGRGPGVGNSSEDVVRSSAVFGGSEIASHSQRFRGGSLTAVFGGVTLDLRQARLAPEGATLSVTAVFGGVDVIVPKDWRARLQGTPIFGGYDDKTEADGPPDPGAPQLTVDILALFGGLDLKNRP